MSRRRPGCLAFILSGGLFNRGSGSERTTDSPGPKTVVVTPNAVTIPQGGTRQLSVAVLDQHGFLLAGMPVTFTTSDPTWATVSVTGLVAAVGEAGGATVIVRCGDATTSVPVNIMPRSSDIGVSPGGGSTPTVEMPATVESMRSEPCRDVVARVPLASAYDVAISRAGTVYVAQITGGLARGDLPNYHLVRIAGGTVGAAGVAFNSTGTTAYVAGLHGPLTVVDVASNAVTATIGSGVVAGTPFASVVAADDRVVILGVGGAVYTIDPITNAMSPPIAVPGGVDHLSVHPTQPLVYATASSAQEVLEIDAQTRAIVRSFAVGGTPQATAVSRDGRTLYIANEDGRLDVVDLASAAVTRIALGSGGGFGMALSPAGTQLCVSARRGVVRWVGVASLSVIHTIEVGGEPRGVAFSADNRTAVVANQEGWVDFMRSPAW